MRAGGVDMSKGARKEEGGERGAGWEDGNRGAVGGNGEEDVSKNSSFLSEVGDKESCKWIVSSLLII